MQEKDPEPREEEIKVVYDGMMHLTQETLRRFI